VVHDGHTQALLSQFYRQGAWATWAIEDAATALVLRIQLKHGDYLHTKPAVEDISSKLIGQCPNGWGSSDPCSTQLLLICLYHCL